VKLRSTFARSKDLLAHPVNGWYELRSRVDREGLFRRYARLARAVPLTHPYFVLSFDCDTMDDIEVVEAMHARLVAMGIHPVYAVPGQLLERGASVYQRIRDAGGEFINHGYTEHTYFDVTAGRQASCFFYDQLPRETVRDDVERGDQCLRDVLGITPRGFRAPHFGTFQNPEQLSFLHGVLQGLGYAFSSSSSPLYGFRYGPAFRRFGILEFPVTGMWRNPLTILDSWGCFEAPDRVLSPSDYEEQGERVGTVYRRLGAGILNLYSDPLHIHDEETFFRAVQRWASVARSVNYGMLLEELS
jgi:hypothetical protein